MGTTDGDTFALIDHWNGKRWTIAPSPRVGPKLYAVSAISPSDVWAVGYYDLLKNGVVRAFIEHWNGSEWTIQPNPVLPSTSDTLLYSVAAASAHNVWVVGDFRGGTTRLIERWNGKTWKIQLGARPGELLGVAAATAKDAWRSDGIVVPLAKLRLSKRTRSPARERRA